MRISTPTKGFTLVEMLVVIGLIVVLMGLATPIILDKLKEGNKIEAMNNGKQISTMLRDFSGKFGSYPDASTAANALERGYYEEGDPRYPRISTPKSANDFLRQLNFIASKNSPLDNKIFFAKITDEAGNSTQKDVTSGKVILPAKTLGFGYVVRIDPDENNSLRGLNADYASNVPLLVTPLKGKGIMKDFKFISSGPMNGEAIIIYNGTSTEKKTILESDLADGLFPSGMSQDLRKTLRVAAPEL